jgi:hypothetical protein
MIIVLLLLSQPNTYEFIIVADLLLAKCHKLISRY